MEKLLYRLTPEEEKVITRMLIQPESGCVFDLAEELNCESVSIYRIRAQALNKTRPPQLRRCVEMIDIGLGF